MSLKKLARTTALEPSASAVTVIYPHNDPKT